MDSAPRTGMSCFAVLEPLGNAPVTITTTNRAPPNAPLENTGQTQVLNQSGNCTPIQLHTDTAEAIPAATR